MYLTNQIDSLIALLKSSEALNDTSIIKAYPYSYKPTLLKHSVIAVSPSQLNAKSIAVGQQCFFGDYAIDFDVFVPQALGSPVAMDVVDRLINALKSSYPIAINLGAINIDSSIKCYSVKCSLTYNGQINLGGDSNE